MESSAIPVASYLIGRSLDCEILASSPRVSKRHAEIRLAGPHGWVRDLGSRYGTTLNGRPVTDWVNFGADDRVVVGNSEVSLDGAGGLEVRPAQAGATVCVEGLAVAVNRGRKVLLGNVSFVVRPGELVALMGLSGAGKSTLLKSLVGIIKPSAGSILINGVDLAKDPVRARLSIGYVPQDDIVHSDLTVREALRHGACMRLPLDTTPDEIEARTAVVMTDLDIAHAARTIIGSAERAGVSGGQRKRVNLALELLSQPPLLLLDEPTSGLSSEDAGNVFALLRQLANDGHTIIVTTHQPSLADFRRFDQVIYLSDGELVYFGPAWPDSAAYFAGYGAHGGAAIGEDAGLALAKLGELKRAGVSAQALAERYAQSPYFIRYVAERLGQVEPDGVLRLPRQYLVPRDSWQQFRNQVVRYVRLKLRNRGSVPIQLAQAPSVAVLVNLVFTKDAVGGNLHYVVYFMAIASVWFGCSNAAREIVGERPILMRERMAGLGIAPYLASKLSVLATLSAVQCAILLGVTAAWRHWPGDLLRDFFLLWSCSLAGILMGLTLSALARSSEAALAATPLLLIPEILLSGLIVPLDRLQALPRLLSNFTASRWGFESLLRSEGLDAVAAQQIGTHAVGMWPAEGFLACVTGLYATVLVLSLAGNPRRFA